VSRSTTQRLDDIVAACVAIRRHLERGDVSDELVFDAIRIRLVEVGEAAKDLPEATRAHEPHIPWNDIARMRDLLAHRYFDTTHAIVDATSRNDIPELFEAAVRLKNTAR